MDIKIKASSINPSMNDMSITISLPNKCPHCAVAYNERPVEVYYNVIRKPGISNFMHAYALYFCPYCNGFFLIKYSIEGTLFDYHGCIERTYPSPSYNSTFSEHLKRVSPRYIDIYLQSEKAENEGLLDICSMGYRTALEFLVKDYAIHCDPDSSEEIKNASLSSCMGKYIISPRIKTLIGSTSWIDDEEPYYIRKQENYNLQYLKSLVSVISSYIDSELSFLAAETLLSSH